MTTYTRFDDEVATLASQLSISDGESLEFDFCHMGSGTFAEIMSGPGTNKFQIQFSAASDVRNMRLFSGGSVDTYVMTDAYAHGCWNTLVLTVTGSNAAMTINGIAVGDKPIVAPVLLDDFECLAQATYLRNIRKRVGGAVVNEWLCDETSGTALVDSAGTNNGTFAAEPRRAELTYDATNDWWAGDGGLDGTITIPEYDPKYVISTEPSKTIKAIIGYGQSLSVGFNDDNYNNMPRGWTPQGAYLTGTVPFRASYGERGVGHAISSSLLVDASVDYVTFKTLGAAATPVANLNKGNARYDTDLLGYVQEIQDSLATNSDTLESVTMTWIQGEADRPTAGAYEEAVTQLFSDFTADVQAIAGAIPVNFYHTQIVISGADGYDIQQIQANTDFGGYSVYSGPQWPIYAISPNLAGGSTDGVHLGSKGYQMQEEMNAAAILDSNWKPLKATACVGDISGGGTLVKLTFDPQTLPLVHDARAIYKQDSSRGFVLVDSVGATTAVDSVTISDEFVQLSLPRALQSGDQILFDKANLRDSTEFGGENSNEINYHWASVEFVDITQGDASLSQPPTANAGPDQSVAAGATVQLDGTGSTAVNPATIASYAWTQTAGDTVTLDDATAAQPVFTSPTTAAAQTITHSLVVTDSEGLTSTADTVDTQVAKDMIPPVITLLGDASVSVSLGDTYTDAGATATDNLDGDLTSSIVTVNPVDTNTAGVYTVTYNVTDSAGNAATEVTRSVTVSDVESTLIASLTGIPNGTFVTRVVDVDNDVVLFSGNKEWSGGSTSFTFNVAVGTNVEYYAYGTGGGAGLQVGVTE